MASLLGGEQANIMVNTDKNTDLRRKGVSVNTLGRVTASGENKCPEGVPGTSLAPFPHPAEPVAEKDAEAAAGAVSGGAEGPDNVPDKDPDKELDRELPPSATGVPSTFRTLLLRYRASWATMVMLPRRLREDNMLGVGVNDPVAYDVDEKEP